MFLEQDAVLGLSRFVAKYVSLSGRNGSVDQLTKRRFIAAAFRHWSFFLVFFFVLFFSLFWK